MSIISERIRTEEERLANNREAKISADILYNLIFLKEEVNNNETKYKDIKRFFDLYIESKKTEDFGYEDINYNKLKEIISLLSYSKRITILDYFISKLKHEFPEASGEWFVELKHEYEIEDIFFKKEFIRYPKAIMLYLSKSILRIIFALLLYFVLATLILYPAIFESCTFFDVEYECYSDVFFINHILNIVALFADLDNNFKVIPLNEFAMLSLIIGKASFIILIINFFYLKITDKMSMK